ncbi:hypothetical protein IFR04_015758 [Cadophora malorum]|uniref:Glycosyltransferase family 8 protein n=1 Tax=Cadophora malorum TaxID=108018 RepID=A0A8H7VY66_9HELO|nr:hypothetical protein IFR04_015758 [Cadophora malorum]
MGPPPRRLIVLGLITTLVLALLLTAHYTRASESALVAKVGGKVQELLHSGTSDHKEEEALRKPKEQPKEPEPAVDSGYDHGTEKGSGGVGRHVHVRPSAPTLKSAGFEGCEYPVVIHVTPDGHCTGVLALYGSIVRNVLNQPEELANKTCVHVTYMDPELKSIEEMYKWPARENPFKTPRDCFLLDSTPALNDVVPVRFNALRGIEKPEFMQSQPGWIIALNKIHSWAFDAYPRILLMDADSIAVTDLHLIFNDADPRHTITGAPDQFHNCGDRSRMNGGMILLRPSRYFHISALEAIYDPGSSCVSGHWDQSEQELLNCLCGYQGPAKGIRPEFECALMPLYNSVWPWNFACSAANVVPIRSVHFTGATKPWSVDEKRLHLRFDYGYWGCLKDAARANSLEAVKKCEFPEAEVSRLLTTHELFAPHD